MNENPNGPTHSWRAIPVVPTETPIARDRLSRSTANGAGFVPVVTPSTLASPRSDAFAFVETSPLSDRVRAGVEFSPSAPLDETGKVLAIAGATLLAVGLFAIALS